MKLSEIYNLAVKMGINADPRGKKEINRLLNKNKDNYDRLEEEDKDLFDQDKLTNPYADTRILCGSPDLKVTGILTGIDLEVSEVLLADRLNERGEKINLLLAHHPEGRALAALPEVLPMQADIWHEQGVPINIGDAMIDKRMREVQRSILPLNHSRPIDAAELLGFAFITVHTPADNLVTQYLRSIFDDKPPHVVGDVIKVLRKIPEYQAAAKRGAGPMVLVGDEEKRAGKVLVDMTGGTGPPEEAIEKLANAGVGTLVSMHASDKLRKKAEENHINIVIAGHTASDGIGLNLFLDKIEGKGIKIIPCSGLVRVIRS